MSKHPNANPLCTVCRGHGWVTKMTPLGRAVQRCDACLFHGKGDPRNVSDEDVAPIARLDGVHCRLEYPCLVEGKSHAIIQEYFTRYGWDFVTISYALASWLDTQSVGVRADAKRYLLDLLDEGQFPVRNDVKGVHPWNTKSSN